MLIWHKHCAYNRRFSFAELDSHHIFSVVSSFARISVASGRQICDCRARRRLRSIKLLKERLSCQWTGSSGWVARSAPGLPPKVLTYRFDDIPRAKVIDSAKVSLTKLNFKILKQIGRTASTKVMDTGARSVCSKFWALRKFCNKFYWRQILVLSK